MKLRPWFFLAVSILIIAGALALSHVAEIIRERRDELIRELDTITRLFDSEREQKNELEQRNRELEEVLINLHRMEQIVTRSAAPSRGGRQLSLTTMPATTPSGYSAARFERALAGTELSGIGEALVQAERGTGTNALVLAAIIVHETGWGQSRLAREKNNLAGLGAYDDAPGRAMRFESRAECVMFLARLLRERPGSLEEIGTWYASDPRWAEKVAGCMKAISEERR